jgi:CubicO group peptidase (beta-lactamase class C family)
VLGEALGAAWGTTYAAALETHVLAPLGLKHTTLALPGLPLPERLAPGHGADGARVGNWTFLACAPAGALRSSARELAIFLKTAQGVGPGSPLHAAWAATLNPPQAPVQQSTGGWDFLTMPQEGGEDLKRLVETKGENDRLVDKMAFEALKEIRGR